jgi:monoamine oxidase
MMHSDTVVIGAGAAGLAAGRALHDGGRRVVLLEARDRIGGRVQTDRAFGAVPVERGAEFIHGAHVETWAWLRRAGCHAVPVRTWAGRRVALGAGRLAGPWLLHVRPDLRHVKTFEERIAAYHGPECSLADWLKAQHASPLAAQIAFLRLAHAYCATPDTLSMAALAHEYGLDTDAGGNFRILEGYDRVLATIAEGLNIHLNTAVEEVRWSGHDVEIVTTGGTWHARHAIITLPLAVLQAGAVRFDPALPTMKQAAIARLAMRPALKLLLRFDEAFWPRDMTFISADDPVPVWWTVRRGEPLLTGFATGRYAERLSALGEEGALVRGLAALDAMFKGAAGRRFVAGAVADWGRDPWAHGGYSSVPPGMHGMRAALAEPCGALHWAGEATVTDSNPATVHGALRSGARAAREIAAK